MCHFTCRFTVNKTICTNLTEIITHIKQLHAINAPSTNLKCVEDISIPATNEHIRKSVPN